MGESNLNTMTKQTRRKHIPCESDLLSTNDQTFAEAMMKCRHAGAFCMQDGYCHFDGECFTDQELTREEAIAEIEHMREEIEDARVKYRQMEAKHLNLIARLNTEKDRAIKKGQSEKVFAFNRCLWILNDPK